MTIMAIEDILAGQFATPGELRNDAAARLDDENPILSGWDVYGLDTAYQTRPPLREIVHGILAEASLNVVFGAPGSLKSMLLADMCACIVMGKPWLEHMPDAPASVAPLPTLATPVLWIDFDNGRRRTHDRFAAIGRAHGLPPDAPFYYTSMPTPWLDASNRVQLLHLSRLIEKRSIGAIFADNLGLISGSADENSADMSAVMGNLRWLADDTGCASTLIHHQRKTGSGDDSIRKGETLRGHSSIEASLDFALHVDRRDGNQVILTPTKTRDAVVFEKAGAMFTYEHAPDSTLLQTARFFGYSVDGKADREMNEIKATVLDIAADTPGLNQTDLVTATRDYMAGATGKTPGVNRVRAGIQQLAEAGRLEIREAPKDSKRRNTEYLHYRSAAFRP